MDFRETIPYNYDMNNLKIKMTSKEVTSINNHLPCIIKDDSIQPSKTSLEVDRQNEP